MIALTLASLIACGPPVGTLVLDFEGDRHFATGGVYRVPDDSCVGPVEGDLDARALITVQNDYLQTTIEVVTVDPDCVESPWLTVAPSSADYAQVDLPAVLRVYAGDELLSAWTVFDFDGGTIVAQP